ncbi:MAG: sensor domain-containing diguanylate cyclase [Betaproteobacteria bacterium]|nr:sensor domain-containing diguanylate cyclase [Betaproteobacteria bacterium]
MDSQDTPATPGAHDERLRLAAIQNLGILDTPPDGAYDRLTRLAGHLFRVPIAIVTVVDVDRIWFKSRLGLDVSEVGRDPGLCASCILQDDVLVYEDARADALALSNPLVAGEFGLRFYAGAPLKTREGHNIGTFCVIDREPREFGDEERASLQDLAATVMETMELRLDSRKLLLQNLAVVEEAEKRANTDAMTGLGNRRGLEADIPRITQLMASGQYADLLATIVDLNGLKLVNDRHGHSAGDRLIKAFGAALQRGLRANDFMYRVGGDEFVILSPAAASPDMASVRERMAAVFQAVREETGLAEAGGAVGVAALSETGNNMQQALELADRRMYDEKKGTSGPTNP